MSLVLLVGFAVSIGQFWFVNSLPQARNKIEGAVSTADHRPLSDMRVFLQNDSYSHVATAITDPTGRFRFNNLLSGTYYVEVDPGATGYERQVQRVEAFAFNERRGGGGEVFRVEFVLRPKESSKGAHRGPAPKDKSSVVFYQTVPETARNEYFSAVKSLEKGNFRDAAASLNHAVEIFPDYYDALELLGAEYVRRQQYQLAIPPLKRAIELNKDGWRAFYSLGIAQDELKQRDGAIVSLRRAIELNPNEPNANMRLGLALAQRAETRGEAIQAFEKVVIATKDKIPLSYAYFYLGGLYSKNDQYGEAADAFESLLRVNPQLGEKEAIKKMIEEFRRKAKTQGQKQIQIK